MKRGPVLRVAAVQTRPVFGDIEGNVEKALALADRIQPQAELYVFPELMTSGYVFASRAEALALAEMPGAPAGRAPGLSLLSAWARARRVSLVAGFPERAGRVVYNSAVLIGPNGRLREVYRKIHLFYEEKLWFAPGDQAPRVLRVGSARLGLLICYDWRFPEAARMLALAGADVIAHPSNLVFAQAQDAMRVRALENRVFVVTANRVGEDVRPDRRVAFTGRSQIAAPDGKVLVRAGAGTPRAIAAALDLGEARDKWFTSRNHLFRDRRPTLYRS